MRQLEQVTHLYHLSCLFRQQTKSAIKQQIQLLPAERLERIRRRRVKYVGKWRGIILTRGGFIVLIRPGKWNMPEQICLAAAGIAAADVAANFINPGMKACR